MTDDGGGGGGGNDDDENDAGSGGGRQADEQERRKRMKHMDHFSKLLVSGENGAAQKAKAQGSCGSWERYA